MSSKLREAVESLLDLLDDFAITEETVSVAHENQCHRELLHTDKTLAVLQKAKAALAEPRRNCEVGTAEEQHKRFMHFCTHVNKSVCGNCPLIGNTSLCQLQWGQLPYKEGEAK